MILLGEEAGILPDSHSPFRKFAELCLKSGARPAVIVVAEKSAATTSDLVPGASGPVIRLAISDDNDPFGLRQQVGLKMLLNAHSTAVMTRLGRVIGNTMTNVSPSNLKLIGRATYLIQSHVNDVLARPDWVKQYGRRDPITYGEANVVLFEAVRFTKKKEETAGQTSEVALSIIRILESLRQTRGLTTEEALEIVRKVGLDRYVCAFTTSAK